MPTLSKWQRVEDTFRTICGKIWCVTLQCWNRTNQVTFPGLILDLVMKTVHGARELNYLDFLCLVQLLWQLEGCEFSKYSRIVPHYSWHEEDVDFCMMNESFSNLFYDVTMDWFCGDGSFWVAIEGGKWLVHTPKMLRLSDRLREVVACTRWEASWQRVSSGKKSAS